MAAGPITSFIDLAIPVFVDILAIVDDVGGTPETKKITVQNLVYKWIGDVDAQGNNLVNTGYHDFNRITIPSDPAADKGRMYVKTLDSNNDGLFMKIKQAGSYVEVQII